MKVAVFGATGMLGTETVAEWMRHGHDVTALTRADADVTQGPQVAEVVARLAPDVVINCTAYNKVDDAEDAPSTAFAVNAWAVRSMARAALAADAVFVHYSTDFVFDGTSDRPYVEDDDPNPKSVYGTSKLVGEWMAADVPSHYILRVESLFGGSASRSTLDRMRAHFEAGQPVTAFCDRTVSPSHVADVARATRALIEGRAPAGLYHCVNSGLATWLEVAECLRDALELPGAEIRSVHAADVRLRAARPQYAALSNARLTGLGIHMPEWTEALKRHLAGVE
jgi:dTDP-4-dehydrorhamnose reductase